MLEFNLNTVLIAFFGSVISGGVTVLAWLLIRLIKGFDENFEKYGEAIDRSNDTVSKHAERFQDKIEKLDEKLQSSAEKMREDISRRDASNHEEFRTIRDHLHRISGAAQTLVSRASIDDRQSSKT